MAISQEREVGSTHGFQERTQNLKVGHISRLVGRIWAFKDTQPAEKLYLKGPFSVKMHFPVALCLSHTSHSHDTHKRISD
jgi:hypothetical protein